MLKNWRFWLGLLISLAFVFWLVTQVRDLERVGQTLREAQYGYLAPALAAYFAGVWLRSVRWHYLLRPIRNIAGRRLFPVVVIGYMANDVLPARMGELVRAYTLDQREGIRKTTSLATILVERVFDGLAMLGFLVGVAVFVPFSPTLQQLALLTGLLFLALTGLIFGVAHNPRLAERVIRRAIRRLPQSLRGRLEKMAMAGLVGLHVLRSGRGVVVVLALSVAAWLCEAAMYYAIALGFFPEVPFYVMLLTVAVANLGTMIPSSPGYVGTFDALAVFTLGTFGVSSEVALGYTAVLHAALIVPVTLLGFIFLWRENLSLGGVRRASSAASIEGGPRLSG